MLMIALCAASVASAQDSAQDVTPGGDVYVKDFVQGDGNTDVKNDVKNCKTGAKVDPVTGKPCGGIEDDCTASNTAAGPDCAVTASCANGASTDPVTGQPCTTATISSGNLPFTGFEAGLVALAGLGLLGAGFGMRRMTRSGPAV
jgi:hypothetical protein